MGFPRHAPLCPEAPATRLPAAASGHARRGRRATTGGALLALSLLATGCAQSAEDAAGPLAAAPAPAELRPAGSAQTGIASFYGPRFTGRRMANGQRFDPHSDTIAHRSLPFGTVVRVTNLENGRTTTARVLDRGPWIRGRIVDVSPRLARDLDMVRSGIARVEVVPVVEVAEAAD
jgi:rare lipoprotein A